MSDASLDLASLLCSRLCHDLMSPVGALSNGLELLSDENDPEMQQRCFALLEQSARVSIDKLRFFRFAFGSPGSRSELVPADEARALVDALAANAQRITVGWALAAETLPKPAVKVLLNLALIGIEALVRGGTLEIGTEFDADAGGSCEIVVRATGDRIAFNPDVGDALEGTLDAEALSARTAPAALVHRVVAGLGGQTQAALGDGVLLLGAILPAREVPAVEPADV